MFDNQGPLLDDILAGFTQDEVQRLAVLDPGLYAAVRRRLDEEGMARERSLYEDSLIAFFERAWREIDPADLSINWHHRVIADNLEMITNGVIREIIANIPPRHTKSILVNVIWPAWVWAQPPSRKGPLSGPHVKFLSVSYGATLAEEIALKMRRLVMGEWYRNLWGERVTILDDQKSRANFGNTAGGERMSSSIEGGILGRGGDVLICDDPQTRKGADSEAERAASLQGMSDLMTRITDPRISAKVLIMQRLHQRDATDWALKNWSRELVHLMFPARFEPDRACPSDPRTRAGELLWPAVWTNLELTKIERGLAALDGEVLSDYAVSGQMQQNPIPRGGGIINPDDWMMWPEHTPQIDQFMARPDGSLYIPSPEVTHVILSLDTAMSEKDTADYNACVVLGVWSRPRNLTQIVGAPDVVDDGEQPRVIMMSGWRMRGKLNDESLDRLGRPMGVVQRVIHTARQYGADRVIIENQTRGLDVKNEIERQISDMPFRVELFNPKQHGDKVARLHAVQPLFSQKLVYAPSHCTIAKDRAGNEYVSVDEFAWVHDVMAEVEQVPRGSHDDYSDALAQALLTLRGDGYLALTQEYVAQQVALRMHRPNRSTIRDSYGV